MKNLFKLFMFMVAFSTMSSSAFAYKPAETADLKLAFSYTEIIQYFDKKLDEPDAEKQFDYSFLKKQCFLAIDGFYSVLRYTVRFGNPEYETILFSIPDLDYCVRPSEINIFAEKYRLAFPSVVNNEHIGKQLFEDLKTRGDLKISGQPIADFLDKWDNLSVEHQRCFFDQYCNVHAYVDEQSQNSVPAPSSPSKMPVEKSPETNNQSSDHETTDLLDTLNMLLAKNSDYSFQLRHLAAKTDPRYRDLIKLCNETFYESELALMKLYYENEITLLDVEKQLPRPDNCSMSGNLSVAHQNHVVELLTYHFGAELADLVKASGQL